MTDLVRQLPTITVLVDNNFCILAQSEEFEVFFNLTNKKIQGKPILNILREDGPELKNILTDCLKTSKTSLGHLKFNSSDILWCEVKAKPWFDVDENVSGVLIDFKDISQQIRAEKKIEKLNMLLEQTSEISMVGMWEYNVITKKLSWSKVTKRIHEVPDDYIPDVESAIEFYKEGYSRNTVSMNFQKAIEKGESFGGLLQIVTASGREVWARNAGKPIYKNGQLHKVVGTFQDVDEQVRAEMKIRENEKLLNSIIDSLPLNVYLKDIDSRKILVNKSECNYLGVKNKSELIGKTDFDFYPKEIAKISREEDLEVIKSQRSIIGKEAVCIKKDGAKTTFLTSKIPLTDINSKPIGIIGLSMDITEIKNKENELHDLINVTAIQNKKLINFAHIVSHNLRSHTANFSMLLKFLVEEEDEAEKKKIINMLTNASDNLMVTLEDLNQVVEISSNVNLEKKQVNIKKQVKQVKENLSAFLQENEVTVIDDSLNGTMVNAVPAYLESILINLFTNAIKYKHPERKPIIKIGHTTYANETILTISDNGLGIDLKKNGEKLFGMYKTFHNYKDSRGIGLYITKNQIEAMGGKITAESKVDHGTTFKLHFYDDGK